MSDKASRQLRQLPFCSLYLLRRLLLCTLNVHSIYWQRDGNNLDGTRYRRPSVHGKGAAASARQIVPPPPAGSPHPSHCSGRWSPPPPSCSMAENPDQGQPGKCRQAHSTAYTTNAPKTRHQHSPPAPRRAPPTLPRWLTSARLQSARALSKEVLSLLTSLAEGPCSQPGVEWRGCKGGTATAWAADATT